MKKVNLLLDKETNESKCTAFVETHDKGHAAALLHVLDGIGVQGGRPVKAEYAQQGGKSGGGRGTATRSSH